MTNEEIAALVDDLYHSVLSCQIHEDDAAGVRAKLEALCRRVASDAYEETIKLAEQRAQKNARLSSERHSQGDVYEAAADEARYIGSLIVALKDSLQSEPVSEVR